MSASKRYAEGTKVTVETSRGEITGILAKHGVQRMGWFTEPDGDVQPAPVIRREACACGGLLELRMGGDVPELVTHHNQTERHEAWSAQTRVL